MRKFRLCAIILCICQIMWSILICFEDYWGEKVLQGAGTISHAQAIEKATEEYRKYQHRICHRLKKNIWKALKISKT